MDYLVEMVAYCYNNCEFHKALQLIDRLPLDAEAALLRIKCLYELDKAHEAAQFADRIRLEFPFNGRLHYQRGISFYLAGRPTRDIEDAFTEALSLGYREAHMGMAFLAFVAKNHDRAIEFLHRAASEDGESEHSRMLKLAQIHMAKEDLESAEKCLYNSKRLLIDSPSLLRSLWSDLCHVRLLRAKEMFEAAKASVDHLLAQLNERTTPRLHRNAVEADNLISARDASQHIMVPNGEPELDKQVLNRITRKPVLYSLYEFLKTCGLNGATKEDIVNEVWQEDYNPLMHDDRLYKSVGRLRRLLGDDNESPRTLILRGRNYVLNRQYAVAGR